MAFAALATGAVAATVVAFVFASIVQLLRARRVWAQGVRGTRWTPLVGDMPQLARARADGQPFFAWFELWDSFGRVSTMWFGPEFRLRLGDPTAARAVLVTESDAFVKPSLMQRMLGQLLGQGLLLSEGEVHKRRRRLVAPAFHAARVNGMADAMVDSAVSAVARWTDVHGLTHDLTGGQVTEEEDEDVWAFVDMHEELSLLTLDIIGRSAFGVEGMGEGCSGAGVYSGLTLLLKAMTASVQGGLAFLPGGSWLPTPGHVAAWREIARLRAQLRVMIADRRSSRTAKGAASVGEGSALLLDHLLDAVESNGVSSDRLSDEECLDEAITFVMAGHETTSQLLSWTLMLLDEHPLVQDAVRAEVFGVCSSRPPRALDLPSMPLLSHVLHEALRLYPPAPIVARTATRDVLVPLGPGSVRAADGSLGGPSSLLIPAGTTVTVPVSALHRSPAYWPHADVFDPSRWANGVGAASSAPGAYLPFSAGPRNCVGQTFALLEAKLILAVILQRLEWRLSPTYVHSPTMMVTLRPAKGMPMLVRARAGST
jgi:cytochrome P450